MRVAGGEVLVDVVSLGEGCVAVECAGVYVGGSEGFDLVLVNGIPVVEEGKPNTALPGKIIRRGRP